MDEHTRNNMIAGRLRGTVQDFADFKVLYPGNKIPEWFSHQTDEWNSLDIHLSPNWLSIHGPFIGFLFSFVFTLNGYVPRIYILFELSFKTNMNSDDRLRRYGLIRLVTDGGRSIYRFETERDHVCIGNMGIDLKDLFGEEWSSVCSNVTETSIHMSIVGDKVIDWEIKKCGLHCWSW
ncbi:hypothetical protein FEM48_Zijuj11G0141400 [Ziziphus jujuba var. spinosa]|uniref:C-JID domain-containing protein n=1 Tax=Ziziphus jujuba var. spinosa TaxID=714518 RepID=A0A978UJD9_ZIZJJ|nr:hypothetical protein FEM48_Zijuj11G0141400 [Ziziphus jujuba var. spinosa]